MLKLWTSTLAIVMVFVMACAPRAAPPRATPAPAAIPAPATAAPAASAPAFTPEEEAWAKVVEAAKREGRVVGYTGSGLLGYQAQALALAFKEKYGVTVEILSTPPRGGVDKVTIEQSVKQPIADWLETGGTSMTEALGRGLLTSIVDELPVLKDRSAFVVNPVFSPGGEILRYGPNITTILVNTKLVKPEDYPRSYRDLLEPKWKGKIIITGGAAQGGTAGVTYITHSFYKTLDDDFWRALIRQGSNLWGGGVTEAYMLVARGEYLMSLGGGGASSAYLIKEGAPLRGDLDMAEGLVNVGYMIGRVKNSPHPNATKLFINWLLSQEAQEVYAKAASRPSLRKDVTDYTPPGARVQPKRILDRTWEVAEYGSKLDWPRIVEQVFGAK